MIKRWDIDAPASSQYHEAPDGEWVEYRDVAALEAQLGIYRRSIRDLEAAEDRINLAIAELEFWYSDPGEHHVKRALALLKGER